MRLFIAILFSDELKDRLCNTIEELKQAAVHGRYTHRDNLHLTLVFIGETNRTEKIKKGMDTVRTEPFSLYIGGIGRFRRNGGDIYWAGVSPSTELLSVYQQLYSVLTADGFQLENREYKPHLTLGRKVELSSEYDCHRLESVLGEAVMPVSRIHLMKSERIDGKLVYTSLYQKSFQSND